MKKTYLLFLAILLSGVELIAQPQLSFSLKNPKIEYYDGLGNYLVFDINIKSDQLGYFLYSGGIALDYNATAFDVTNVVAFKGTLLEGTFQYGPQQLPRYAEPSVTINSGRINIPVIPGNNNTNANPTTPSSRFNQVPIEWITLYTVWVLIDNPSEISGIFFYEEIMNGQQFHTGAEGGIAFKDPNIYISPTLQFTNLGRVFSESIGWSQLNGSLDWLSPVNTTVFDGNATITQTDLTAAVANNLNIMPGATLSIGSNKWLTVNGTLSTPDADALILADQGSLIHQTAGVEASIKRNISGGSINPSTYRYHLVAVPMHESSVFNAGNLFTGMHLWEMDPATQAWQKITSATHAINNHEGYLLWHDGVNHELNFAGTLNADNVALPSEAIGINGDGFSYRLIPNPYPSAMQWNTPAGYDAAVYFFDAATGNYKSFADGVPSPAIVPYGQSFFIKTTNPGGTAPAITIAANTRLHHEQGFYKSVEAFSSLLQIKASTSFSEDETFVRFHSAASNAFDPDKDALKLFGFGDAPQLYTFGENQNFAINTLETSNEATIVPLHFSMTTDGAVSLDVSGLSNFENQASIYLEDIFLNEMIDLHEQQQYAFDHQLSNASHRFNLHFYGVLGDQEVPVEKWKVWSYNQYVYINIPHGEEISVQVELFDMTGRMLYGKQHAVNNPIIVYGGQLPQMVLVKITSAKRSLNQVLFIQ